MELKFLKEGQWIENRFPNKNIWNIPRQAHLNVMQLSHNNKGIRRKAYGQRHKKDK
jgi:hypothetical protein